MKDSNPPPLHKDLAAMLGEHYKKEVIPDVYARAWAKRDDDILSASPFLRPAIFTIREHVVKPKPFGVGGHSDIRQHDEDWFKVWNG